MPNQEYKCYPYCKEPAMPVQPNDKMAEQQKLIILMSAVLPQIEQIAAHRAAFCKRYRDYAITCTPEDYDSFRNSFLPQIKIAESSFITPNFLQYDTKDAFINFFNTTLSNYTKAILQIKKILKGLENVETDADFDPIKRNIDRLLLFFTEWTIETGYYFDAFKRQIKQLLIDRHIPYSNVIDHFVNDFKKYALPEIDFVNEMTQLLDKIITDAAMPTMAAFSELNEVMNSNDSPDVQLKKSLDIVKEVQVRLKRDINDIKSTLENLRRDDPEEKFLTQLRANTILSDLEPAVELLAPNLAREIANTAKEPNDWYDYVYELNWIIMYCADIKLELKGVKELISKNKQSAKKKPVTEASDLTHAVSQLSLDSSSPNKKVNEQEYAEILERQKQAAIEAQNAMAKEARKNRRPDIQKSYQQEMTRKLAVEEDEEEETAGSTKSNLFVLNKKNYDILVAIFAEEHNTITYAQVENLIKCETIGGKITSGGGSGRKITIRGIDIHTFEPIDNTVAGGFHAKHRAGHNDKLLIKPIVQDIKAVLEKAGFNPTTCVAKKDATPTTTPTSTPESSPRPTHKKKPS
jgi:hypothetical protein